MCIFFALIRHLNRKWTKFYFFFIFSSELEAELFMGVNKKIFLRPPGQLPALQDWICSLFIDGRR